MNLRVIISAFMCVILASAGVQAAPVAVSDSVSGDDYRFRPRQLIVPGVLVAVGAWGVSNGWIKHLDRDVRHALKGSHSFASDDYMQFLPLAANLGVGALGVESRHCFRDRALSTVTSWLLLEVAVQGLKHTVNSTRPDGSDSHSFPSGHAARAFMGAELMRIEYGDWWGLGAYTIAAAVGVMRIHNDRHWLSDTLAGAGIGILCARAGNWLLPLERKLLGLDRRRHNVAALPFYDNMSGSVGASLVLVMH